MPKLSATTNAPGGVTYTPQVKAAPVPTNLGAGTRDLLTASGDVAIVGVVVAVGPTGVTGLVSVAIQDNDAPTTIMTAAEGAVANLITGAVPKLFATAYVLHSGKKIQYTIVGTGLGGSMTISVLYVPLVFGAVLA